MYTLHLMLLRCQNHEVRTGCVFMYLGVDKQHIRLTFLCQNFLALDFLYAQKKKISEKLRVS